MCFVCAKHLTFFCMLILNWTMWNWVYWSKHVDIFWQRFFRNNTYLQNTSGFNIFSHLLKSYRNIKSNVCIFFGYRDNVCELGILCSLASNFFCQSSLKFFFRRHGAVANLQNNSMSNVEAFSTVDKKSNCGLVR